MKSSKNFYPVFVFGLAVIPFLAIQFPRILTFYPSMIGIIMCVWWVFLLKKKLYFPRTYLILAGCIAGLATLSTLWSFVPDIALKKGLSIGGILIGASFVLALLPRLDYACMRPHLWLFPVFMILAALLACVDLTTDLAVYKAIHAPDRVINGSVLNRGLVVYTLMFFPVLAMLRRYDLPYKNPLTIAMIVTTLGALILSESQSAQLAFIAAAVFYALALYIPAWGYAVMAGIIAAALLLSPLIAQLLFYYGLDGFAEYPFLKHGYAGHRLEIWDFVSRRALESPYLGFGVEATRHFESFDHGYIIHKEPTLFHPHNFALQIWIEFGGIGAILGSLLLVYLLYGIKNAQKADQQVLLAVFMAILCVLATGYGMWQGWWLGTISLSFAMCILAKNSQDVIKNSTKCIT